MYLFDIKNNFSQSSEIGYEFAVLTAWGEKTDFFIKVRGEQSKLVRDFSKRQYNENQMKERAAKARGKVYDMDIEDAETSLLDSCFTRIISWKGLTDNGVAVPLTKENSDKLLRGNDHIQTQILEESRLTENFRPV